jgi:hypothetical protein
MCIGRRVHSDAPFFVFINKRRGSLHFGQWFAVWDEDFFYLKKLAGMMLQQNLPEVFHC